MFTRSELEAIAGILADFPRVIAISDEVGAGGIATTANN